jgi:hypothetical protein
MSPARNLFSLQQLATKQLPSTLLPANGMSLARNLFSLLWLAMKLQHSTPQLVHGM